MSSQLIKDIKSAIDSAGLEQNIIISVKNSSQWNGKSLTLSVTDAKLLISKINDFGMYNNLPDSDKKAIFELSKRYMVRLIENVSGIKLELYSTKTTFVHPISNTFCEKSTEVHQNEIIYSSNFHNADIRSVMIPKINYLKYDCSCVDFCQCVYLNLPKIASISDIKISNNNSEYLDLLISSEYERYLLIHPRYLYKHLYINKTLEVLYQNYLIDFCKRVNPPKINKFWTTLIKHSNGNYSISIYNTKLANTFPFISDIKHILSEINIVQCRYYPDTLENVCENFNSIEKKLIVLGKNVNIKLKYNKNMKK